MARISAGYSGTPLAKKLGIKEATRILPLHAPDEYARMLDPIPPGVHVERRAGPAVDVAHVFVTRQADLKRQLSVLRAKLRPDAVVWVSWPKKTSKVPTDISEDTIRAVALPMGLVDIKVCTIDETWSGLKLVLRKELRAR